MKKYIERELLIGCIVSDQYLRSFVEIYKPAYINSKTAKKVIGWCVAYYEKYKKAPNKDINTIYKSNLKSMSEEEADWIAEVLEFLSEEYEDENIQFNDKYLLDQTKEYFEERSVKILAENIETELANNNVKTAVDLATRYKTVETPNDPAIDPYKGTDKVREAFDKNTESLFRFNGALGFLLNPQLVREGFIAFQAPEKTGKTFFLSECKFMAEKYKCGIAFFQAGDMSELQQLRRWYIHMAGKSNKKRYCRELMIPVLDCKLNQNGECSKSPNDEFPFDGMNVKDFASTPMENYKKAFEEFPDHKPCRECQKDLFKFKGTVWFRKREQKEPLTWKEAIKAKNKYWKRHKINNPRTKLATYPSDSLSVSEIERQLDIWEERQSFRPDVIIVDYADLLVPSRGMQDNFRHQQNQIWKDLRSLSQKRRCLVITATQADANSYKKETQDRSNFSEDKRKYGHVTAMYSINKTNEEKKIGIMRIGELVVRENDFYYDRQVAVLGRLEIGRSNLGSYFV